MTLAMRLLVRLLATCALCGALSLSRADDSGPLTPLPDQAPAPDFALAGVDGRLYRLADYRGRTLVINFWATWCPPCRAEMPSMQRAYAALTRDGIALVAISVGDDAQAIRAFLGEVPVSFPLPMDPDSRIAQQYPMIGLPTTFVVDRAGRLVYSLTGQQDWDDPALLEQIRALR